MSYNKKEIKVDSPSKMKNPNLKLQSKWGYRDDSPYNQEPWLDIYTPDGTIDMSHTGIPLMANGQYLPPYSGVYQFPTKHVKEVPVMARGGYPSAEKALAFLEAGTLYNRPLTQKQIDRFMQLANVTQDEDGNLVPIEAVESEYDWGYTPNPYDENIMKRGGTLKHKSLKQGSRRTTSKNIQSSISPLFLRNYDLYGPAGHHIYTPHLQEGGWLDSYAYSPVYKKPEQQIIYKSNNLIQKQPTIGKKEVQERFQPQPIPQPIQITQQEPQTYSPHLVKHTNYGGHGDSYDYYDEKGNRQTMGSFQANELIKKGIPVKQMGGWLDSFQGGGQPNWLDFV